MSWDEPWFSKLPRRRTRFALYTAPQAGRGEGAPTSLCTSFLAPAPPPVANHAYENPSLPVSLVRAIYRLLRPPVVLGGKGDAGKVPRCAVRGGGARVRLPLRFDRRSFSGCR